MTSCVTMGCNPETPLEQVCKEDCFDFMHSYGSLCCLPSSAVGLEIICLHLAFDHACFCNSNGLLCLHLLVVTLRGMCLLAMAFVKGSKKHYDTAWTRLISLHMACMFSSSVKRCFKTIHCAQLLVHQHNSVNADDCSRARVVVLSCSTEA